MEGQYNVRSPAVKRLMKEAQELREPTEQFYAQPLEDNLFEWHFTIRGPAESEFDGGIYHGRIILPPEYPMKPPSIIILTPNGRFETHKKICLSISGYHPESWQPSWSLRTALLAIIGFMPTHGNGAIGSLDYSADERKVLARKSNEWKCEQCGHIRTLLKPVTEASQALNKEAKELGSQIKLQGEKDKPATSSASSSASEVSTSSNSSASVNAAPAFTSAHTNTNNPYPAVNPFMMNPAQFAQLRGTSLPSAATIPYPPFPMFMPHPGQVPPFMPPYAQQANGTSMSLPMWRYGAVPPGYPWTPFGMMPQYGANAGSVGLSSPVASTTTVSQQSHITTEHTSSMSTHSTVVPNSSSDGLPNSSALKTSSQASSSANQEAGVASSSGFDSACTARTPTSTTASEVSVSHQADVSSIKKTSVSNESKPPAVSSPSSTSVQPAASRPVAGTDVTNAAVDDDPVLSANEIRRRRTGGRHNADQSAEVPVHSPVSRHGANWLVNIILATLVLCIAILLARRLYMLGRRW